MIGRECIAFCPIFVNCEDTWSSQRWAMRFLVYTAVIWERQCVWWHIRKRGWWSQTSLEGTVIRGERITYEQTSMDRRCKVLELQFTWSILCIMFGVGGGYCYCNYLLIYVPLMSSNDRHEAYRQHLIYGPQIRYWIASNGMGTSPDDMHTAQRPAVIIH